MLDTARRGGDRIAKAREHALPAISIFLTLAFAGTLPSVAEELKMRVDGEGNVHFGNSSEPELCCMCQKSLRYEVQPDQTRFDLASGLSRSVGNDRVFLSPDGDAWYCEGVREMGSLSRKCGLVPDLL